jgi:hypothetical protein
MEGGIYLSNLFDESGHISYSSLKKLKNNSLTDDELIKVSEHIADCEKCSGYLAESFNEDELVDAPYGFQEEVKRKINKKSINRSQFFFYSMRVAVAACLSLIILFSSTLKFMADTTAVIENISAPNFKVVNSINRDLSNFTNKIVNMEVCNNENEKR